MHLNCCSLFDLSCHFHNHTFSDGPLTNQEEAAKEQNVPNRIEVMGEIDKIKVEDDSTIMSSRIASGKIAANMNPRVVMKRLTQPEIEIMKTSQNPQENTKVEVDDFNDTKIMIPPIPADQVGNQIVMIGTEQFQISIKDGLGTLVPSQKQARRRPIAQLPQQLSNNRIEEFVKSEEDPIKSFDCKICLKSFSSESAMYVHMDVEHINDGMSIKCELCDKEYDSWDKLHTHKSVVHIQANFKCEHCTKAFLKPSALKSHTNSVHPEFVDKSNFYQCDQCDKSYETKASLTSHINNAHSENPFNCENCDKSFPYSFKLKRNNVAVHETKEKACQSCWSIIAIILSK